MTILSAIVTQMAETPAWFWIATFVGVATTLLFWVVLEE